MQTETDEVARFQQLKAKVDEYNNEVIAAEVKKQQAEEELSKLLQDLKDLGYSSLEEAEAKVVEMQQQIVKELDEMEAQLNGNQ